MRQVLVLTVDCWNKDIGTNSSYTFSNLFSSMTNYEFSNIYIRDEMPNDSCCKRYFQISENRIIKSIFNRKIRTGKEVYNNAIVTESVLKNISQQKKLYSKQRSSFYYLKKIIRELIWFISPWKSKELDEFIDDIKPDSVVFAMEGYIHFNRICRYVLQRTGAKGVGYFWDDCFTYKQTKGNAGRSFLRFFQRISLKKLAQYCEQFWAITEKTKKEADAFFGISSHILTKPIDFSSDDVWKEYTVNKPIRVLYTGNLMIGRFEIIKEISRAFKKVNKDSVKIVLDVYTQSQIEKNKIEQLTPQVRIHDPVTTEKVLELQQNADILLFAEALSGSQRLIARLSFSTKLTDYFRSGKCILAIGSSDVAPMEYLHKQDAALCANSSEEIYIRLNEIVERPYLINEYGKKAFECGLTNHSRQAIQKIINDTFESLV